MNVKFSKEQALWLSHVTGEEELQEAVNFFLKCMKAEGIAGSDILVLIDMMIKRVPKLPPGKK